MIETKLYVLQAFTHLEKKDEHGRPKVGWRRIHAQVKNGTFEYTTNEAEAKTGDFEDSISYCKAINLANQDERIIKIVEEVKDKKKEPKSLQVRMDEDKPQDLSKLCNAIDTHNKGPKEIGRPLLLNVHSGRGVSALSRGITHSDYRGIVTILLILLIISNMKNILKQGSQQGWYVGSIIFEFVTNPSSKITISGL